MRHKVAAMLCLFLSLETMALAGNLVEKRPIIMREGRDQASSFNAALVALREKEYFIETVDKEKGLIVTRKWNKDDWWWYFNITVAQDGAVTFEPVGSPNVMTETKMHSTLERYGAYLSEKVVLLLHYYENDQLKFLAGKFAM